MKFEWFEMNYQIYNFLVDYKNIDYQITFAKIKK
jgi:hypothetical protein